MTRTTLGAARTLQVALVLFAFGAAGIFLAASSAGIAAASEISIVATCPEESQAEPSVLMPAGTADAPPTHRFVASDHFADGTASKGQVRFKLLSDIFTRYFDVVEENVEAAELRMSRLRDAALDTSIIAELSNRHETRLAHLWALLVGQGNGEEGPLLIDGRANIFYIRDAKGVLWALSVVWDDGWEIVANTISGPYPWRAGRQIVSR